MEELNTKPCLVHNDGQTLQREEKRIYLHIFPPSGYRTVLFPKSRSILRYYYTTLYFAFSIHLKSLHGEWDL